MKNKVKTREKRTTTSFVKRVKEDEQEKEKIDYNTIQMTLYEELNILRQNPQSYIPLIESQMRTIKKIIFSKKKILIYKFKQLKVLTHIKKQLISCNNKNQFYL